MEWNTFFEFVSPIVSHTYHIASILTERMREVGSLTYLEIYLPSSTGRWQLYKIRANFHLPSLSDGFLAFVFAQLWSTTSKTHASASYLHADVPTTTKIRRNGMRLLVSFAFDSSSHPPILQKELQNHTAWSWVRGYSFSQQ